MAFFSLWLFPLGCTESFEIETLNYENVLVVESTITNEMKQQVVKLSRTSALENPGILTENNASVTVSGNNGDSFSFAQDAGTGFYISDQSFSALPNVAYTLSIQTQDGKSYKSSEVVLPPTVEMDQVYAERIEDATNDKDGAQVLVNTEDPTGSAKYFRYEYEEASKIVIPSPSPYYAEIVNYNTNTGEYDIQLTPRVPDTICYATANSTGIIQTSTNEFSQDRVDRFPVRYIDKDNSILRERYSILVKQYIQSLEAYTFYKIIDELGSVESLLSQGQPGYVEGNLVYEADSEEKVLGFFEASSVSSKRIFFNYEDVSLEKPPYMVDCKVDQWNYDVTGYPIDHRVNLWIAIKYKNYQVLSAYHPIYRIVQAECSTCTSISSNIKPNFWID